MTLKSINEIITNDAKLSLMVNILNGTTNSEKLKKPQTTLSENISNSNIFNTANIKGGNKFMIESSFLSVCISA